MDFVVSKVAMSICALLVAGVISGCMDPANFADPEHELDCMVEGLCGLVDRAVLSNSRCSLVWPVPNLPDGQEVRVVIRCGLVTAEAGDESSTGQPVTDVHTWRNTGAAMNVTGLALLDESADEFEASSGERILIETELVLLENLPTFLAFVRKGS